MAPACGARTVAAMTHFLHRELAAERAAELTRRVRRPAHHRSAAPPRTSQRTLVIASLIARPDRTEETTP
jgi:hypothetical protein